jgi:hypothetical protein
MEYKMNLHTEKDYWITLRTYQIELSQLAFGTIPDEKLVEDSFMKIVQRLL